MRNSNTREIEYTEVDFMTPEEQDEYLDFLYEDFRPRKEPQDTKSWLMENEQR